MVVLDDGSELPPQTAVEAQVCDISATGVGLLLPAELPLSAILLIEPRKRVRGRRMHLLVARVDRTAFQPAGWYHGCELGHRLTLCELENWLA